MLADVAQLADERGRGMAGRAAHELDERRRADRRARRSAVAPSERRLQPGDHVLVARALAEDPVVDELAQRTEGRVLVGDPDEQQLLEPIDGRLGLGADAREGAPRSGRAAGRRRSPTAAHVVQGRRHGGRPGDRLVPGDQQVADLVEQAERPDLARAVPTRLRAAESAFIRAASRGSRRSRRRRGRRGRRAASSSIA